MLVWWLVVTVNMTVFSYLEGKALGTPVSSYLDWFEGGRAILNVGRTTARAGVLDHKRGRELKYPPLSPLWLQLPCFPQCWPHPQLPSRVNPSFFLNLLLSSLLSQQWGKQHSRRTLQCYTSQEGRAITAVLPGSSNATSKTPFSRLPVFKQKYWRLCFLAARRCDEEGKRHASSAPPPPWILFSTSPSHVYVSSVYKLRKQFYILPTHSIAKAVTIFKLT